MTSRPLVLVTFARPLYVLILAVAILVLLRGHNEPGGGFIGGLIAACASLLCALAQGKQAALRRMPFCGTTRLAASGVVVALASGLPALLTDAPFLTHLWIEPLGLPLSTVLLFDAGVFLCVWGSVAGYGLALVGLGDADPARQERETRP